AVGRGRGRTGHDRGEILPGACHGDFGIGRGTGMTLLDATAESKPEPQAPDLAEQRRHGFNAGELVYQAPPTVPTQEGPRGIRFDANDGCRVLVPEGKWRVRLSDLDAGNILFETETGGVLVNSTKRYYMRFRIEVWQKDELVLHHDFDPTGREVL